MHFHRHDIWLPTWKTHLNRDSIWQLSYELLTLIHFKLLYLCLSVNLMQGKSYHLLDCFSSIFNVNVFCFFRHLLHETPIKFKIINFQGTKLPFKTIYIQKTFCNISRLKIWILQRKKVNNKQISSMASVCFSSVLISVY